LSNSPRRMPLLGTFRTCGHVAVLAIETPISEPRRRFWITRSGQTAPGWNPPTSREPSDHAGERRRQSPRGSALAPYFHAARLALGLYVDPWRARTLNLLYCRPVISITRLISCLDYPQEFCRVAFARPPIVAALRPKRALRVKRRSAGEIRCLDWDPKADITALPSFRRWMTPSIYGWKALDRRTETARDGSRRARRRGSLTFTAPAETSSSGTR